VQTVVGGPHTRCRRGRQHGQEAPPPEKDVYICHVGAILDMLSTELVNAPEQALVLDRPGSRSLRFGLGTFFGPDSVHAQHLLMICSVGCSVILPVASDKRPLLVSCDGW